MNTSDIIEAVGYLSPDLARNLTDTDIQHDWKRLLKALGEEPAELTTAQLDSLRVYAA
jgi:hypothetical protein